MARPRQIAVQVVSLRHQFAQARAHLHEAAACGASEDASSRVRLAIEQALGEQLPAVLAERQKIAEAIQCSEWLLTALWPTASRDIAGQLPTGLDSLVIQALKEVIDVHTERLAAAEYRLPRVILWLLCVVALTGLALTGFGSGLHGRRSMRGIGALAVLVMAVILSIIALDSLQQGFIRLSQTSLIRWRDRLQAETTTTALPQPAPPLQRDTQ